MARDRDKYLGNLFYDVAKAAIIRMSYGMAEELRMQGVAALALAPGFVLTERVMAVHALQPFSLERTESPAYAGRAVAHLAADPLVMQKSGKVLAVGDLAQEYGFTDTDGKQPPAFRYRQIIHARGPPAPVSALPHARPALEAHIYRLNSIIPNRMQHRGGHSLQGARLSLVLPTPDLTLILRVVPLFP